MPGALPNLIVIGAMKCGTSSLHYYLGLHPEIQMSQPKELHFFVDEADFEPRPFMAKQADSAALRGPSNWNRGLDWYRGHFSPDARIRGESTVAYSFPWYRGTPERMALTVPDARLILVVRDPIERMISHYLAYSQAGRESRPMADAFEASNNWYLAASRYASILEPYLTRFDREQLLVVRQSDLLLRRGEALGGIFRFLGVDAEFWSEKMEAMRNRAAAKGTAYRLAERVRRARYTRPLLDRVPASVKSNVERMLSSRQPVAESPELPSRLRRELQRELEPEIGELERLTSWDLDDWRWKPAEQPDRYPGSSVNSR